MTLPNLPPVAVAGLLVPAPLVPRIIASLRGTYPQLTADLDDDAAVRAVLKFWVTSTLASYEAARAEAPVSGAVEATRAEYAERAEAARQKALQDAAQIIEAPGDTGTAGLLDL